MKAKIVRHGTQRAAPGQIQKRDRKPQRKPLQRRAVGEIQRSCREPLRQLDQAAAFLKIDAYGCAHVRRQRLNTGAPERQYLTLKAGANFDQPLSMNANPSGAQP